MTLDRDVEDALPGFIDQGDGIHKHTANPEISSDTFDAYRYHRHAPFTLLCQARERPQEIPKQLVRKRSLLLHSAKMPETLETLETVSLHDSNFSDTLKHLKLLKQ